MANERKCAICGKQYHYCFKCEKIAGYRFYTDTPECYQIHVILREYREGVLTAEEAAKRFVNIGITNNFD